MAKPFKINSLTHLSQGPEGKKQEGQSAHTLQSTDMSQKQQLLQKSSDIANTEN